MLCYVGCILRLLVTGSLPLRLGFDCRIIHVGLMVEELTLREVSLRVLRYSLQDILLAVQHATSTHTPQDRHLITPRTPYAVYVKKL